MARSCLLARASRWRRTRATAKLTGGLSTQFALFHELTAAGEHQLLLSLDDDAGPIVDHTLEIQEDGCLPPLVHEPHASSAGEADRSGCLNTGG